MHACRVKQERSAFFLTCGLCTSHLYVVCMRMIRDHTSFRHVSCLSGFQYSDVLFHTHTNEFVTLSSMLGYIMEPVCFSTLHRHAHGYEFFFIRKEWANQPASQLLLLCCCLFSCPFASLLLPQSYRQSQSRSRVEREEKLTRNKAEKSSDFFLHTIFFFLCTSPERSYFSKNIAIK